MHRDGHSMDHDSARERELQALSFNPFGDSLDNIDTARDDRAVFQDEVTHRLGKLHITSNSNSNSVVSSSNASSAVSGHTVPLFDTLDAGVFSQKQQPASTPSSSSLLNPAAGSYAPPPTSSAFMGGSAPAVLHKSTTTTTSTSPSIVHITMGSGSGSPSVRRHRLSSASSGKSTRSRRSTNSSLSSIAIKMLPQPDGDPHSLDFADFAAASMAGNGQESSPKPPPTARPIVTSNNSQDSMISLQPSVLSLESASKGPPPVAGYRIPATGSLRHSSFPPLSMCGPAFKDFDEHPIYVCSAILGTAIHPAKAGPHLSPPVRISFAGKEILHEGRFDLLPITTDMKWYNAKDGIVPEGKEPIQAGYEESGEQLHHALARIQGFWVPGKTGTHLKGANFPFAGREVRMHDGYKILCWRREGTSIADSESTEVPPPPHHVIDNYTRSTLPTE